MDSLLSFSMHNASEAEVGKSVAIRSNEDRTDGRRYDHFRSRLITIVRRMLSTMHVTMGKKNEGLFLRSIPYIVFRNSSLCIHGAMWLSFPSTASFSVAFFACV